MAAQAPGSPGTGPSPTDPAVAGPAVSRSVAPASAAVTTARPTKIFDFMVPPSRDSEFTEGGDPRWQPSVGASIEFVDCVGSDSGESQEAFGVSVGDFVEVGCVEG